MHKASPEEQDMPCNAWCEGEVHADLAYAAAWSPVTPENAHESLQKAHESLQKAADHRAKHGELSPIEIVAISVAHETPPVDERYPGAHLGLDVTAYLVRYRLKYEADLEEVEDTE